MGNAGEEFLTEQRKSHGTAQLTDKLNSSFPTAKPNLHLDLLSRSQAHKAGFGQC